MNELVLSIPGRPVTIQYKGWTEFISIHDQNYLKEKKRLMKRTLDVHPDRMPKGGSTFFRQRRTQYVEFRLKERWWYWSRGLMPPDWRGPPEPPPHTVCHYRRTQLRERN